MKKNWKTSLAGVLGGLLITFGPAAGARLQGDTSVPPITAQNYISGIALAVLGALGKDGDVTGGSRQQ